MGTIVETVFAGLLGTLAMSLLMGYIHRAGIANADMIRAIGSVATGSYENSFIPGLAIHLVAGVVISFFYVALMSLLNPGSFITSALTGAMIGLFHGVAVSFMLVVSVAEHHPIEEFQDAGSEVAVAHLAGHLLYGLVVGGAVGLMGVRYF
ncbi:MAG: DUF6789 family protein [Deltaproteobacteria bacterium]